MEQLGPLLDAAKREGQSIMVRGRDRFTSYGRLPRVTNAALEHGITTVYLPPLRRDEQSQSRARTAAFWLGFTWDAKAGRSWPLWRFPYWHTPSAFMFSKWFIRRQYGALLPPPAGVGLITPAWKRAAAVFAGSTRKTLRLLSLRLIVHQKRGPALYRRLSMFRPITRWNQL